MILWVKMMGAVLLVTAFGLVGLFIADSFMRRPKELRELLTALQLLETEIMYGAVPLPDALQRIERFCGSPTRELFAGVGAALCAGQGCTAGEAWKMTLAAIFPESALTDTDRAILDSFGCSLGASDREDQVKHITLAREQLKREEAKAAEEGMRYARLWKYLGFLTGLAVCLAII